MAISDTVRRLTPQPALTAYRRWKTPVQRYQGVTTEHNMRALHEGRFADLLEQAVADDPTVEPDDVRLRIYTVAELARSIAHVPGDAVSIGISYGTAPKVLFRYAWIEQERTLHLVDPFSGICEPGAVRPYNTDHERLMREVAGEPYVKLHRVAVPDGLPLPIDRIAFVHFNTGHPEAEAATIQWLWERLSVGGMIVCDSYAFGRGHQAVYDPVAAQLGASIMTWPSGQGLLVKTRAD